MNAKDTATSTLAAAADRHPPQPLNPKLSGHRHLLFLAVLCALLPFSALPWPAPVTGAAATLALCYTLLSNQLLRCSKPSNQQQLTTTIAYGDALITGLILSLVNFNLASYLVMFGALQFSALLNGGWRCWRNSSLAFTLGTLTTLWLGRLWPEQYIAFNAISLSSLNLNPTANLATLIATTLYFCATAAQVFYRLRKFSEQQHQLERARQKHKLRAYKLARYLPPPVWEAINRDQEQALQTERKQVTVFFSDITDFSQLAEELDAEALTELLNIYFTEMSQLINQFGGTIDKFMGDSIMAIFGDIGSRGAKADCMRCLAMSIAMRKRIAALQPQWLDLGLKKPLKVRMGINTGFCTVGTLGINDHLDYTVLGTEVNLASRLESAAQPGEILISHNSWSLAKDAFICRDRGTIKVKGSSQSVQVYQVIDFRKDLGKGQ